MQLRDKAAHLMDLQLVEGNLARQLQQFSHIAAIVAASQRRQTALAGEMAEKALQIIVA